MPSRQGHAHPRTDLAATPGVALSSRQVEILQLLAEGLTRAEAGALLFVSEQTVKTHLGRARHALGVRTTTAAVAAAFRMGVIR